MIRSGDRPVTLDELQARIDNGDDTAYVEAATLLWGKTAGESMARARAKFNREPVPETNTPDPDVPSGADADRAAGWHLSNDAGV